MAESFQSDMDSFVGTAKGVQSELAKATGQTVDRVYSVLDQPVKEGGASAEDANENTTESKQVGRVSCRFLNGITYCLESGTGIVFKEICGNFWNIAVYRDGFTSH